MSEAMEKAFEQALIESIGGGSPEQKFKKAHVAKFLRVERRAIKDELKSEKLSWKAEQKAMREQSMSDTDPEWIDAKELHELNIRICMQDMDDIRKMM
jgi:hypothetical protein